MSFLPKSSITEECKWLLPRHSHQKRSAREPGGVVRGWDVRLLVPCPCTPLITCLLSLNSLPLTPIPPLSGDFLLQPFERNVGESMKELGPDLGKFVVENENIFGNLWQF